MRIIIKTTKVKLTESLRRLIREKILSLEKFLEEVLKKEDVFNGRKPRTEAFIEVGKPSFHHKKGNVFYAECQITLPGKRVRAVAERENLELALSEVKNELERQLKKYKGSRKIQQERNQRRVKKDIKLSKAARFYRKGRIREEGM